MQSSHLRCHTGNRERIGRDSNPRTGMSRLHAFQAAHSSRSHRNPRVTATGCADDLVRRIAARRGVNVARIANESPTTYCGDGAETHSRNAEAEVYPARVSLALTVLVSLALWAGIVAAVAR